ncbi:MAG: hypothetical protein AAF747_04590 [Planctomycetota bacterium]
MRWLWCSSLAFVATSACAQSLDFGGPSRPSEDDAARSLAATLEAEAEALGAREDGPAEAFGIALREVAAAMLERAADDTSDEASQLVVFARTLAVHRGAFDGELRELLSKLDALDFDDAQQLAEAERTLAIVAATVELLDAVADSESVGDAQVSLRDALAMLARETGVEPRASLWLVADGRLADVRTSAAGVAGLADHPLLTPEAQRAAASLASDIEASAGWAAYQASATTLAELVLRAATLLDDEPRWLTADARKRVADDLSDALAGVQLTERRDASVSELQRLAMLAEVVIAIDTIGTNEVGRATVAAVNELAAAAPGDARRSTGAQRTMLQLVRRVLGQIETRAALPSDRELARRVRPAFRAVQPLAREAEQRAIAVLPMVMQQADAMTDPGVLQAVAANERALDDLVGLVRIEAMLVEGLDGEGASASARSRVTADSMRRVGERLVDLGGEMIRREPTPELLDDLRLMIDQLKWLVAFPGEDELRTAVAAPRSSAGRAWDEATGGRASQLADALDGARETWATSWSGEVAAGRLAADSRRVTTMADLLTHVRDAAAVARAERDGFAFDRWPGWEIDDDARRALTEGLTDATEEATRLALDGNLGRARAAMEDLLAEHATGLLVGRLELHAARAGWRGTERSADDVLRELVAGRPLTQSGVLQHAGELASVCRFAPMADDADVRAWLNEMSRGLLESLPAD